ncbi:MAG: MBOAT family O-acyltransferase [Bryobacteraceae bacterium]
MLPSSSGYFIFLLGIFFLYWPLARVRLLALALVLFANYFFYAKWDLFYLALIPIASFCDFLLALALDRSKNKPLRRLLVTLSILMNVGILASFKYMPFFLGNYARISGHAAPAWHWTFPLGISFYTFQALTYTIDVYRRDARATSSLLAYLCSVSFFPTTLAGPITRVADLIPQFERKDKTLAPSDGGRALFLIGLGLMKKLLIADYLADNLVNRVFDFPNLYTGAEVLIAVYAYTLQIYYDFSGYTDIARGSAQLLGIKLPINFNMPYAAANVADFWRRWHITLSHWLRDYLYFSLPGLRSKWKVFTYWNLILTMAIGGLWHGASWNFAIWGLLHGIGLAVTHFWQTLVGREPVKGFRKFAGIFCTLQFVCFTWIFFRAPTLSAAFAILARIGSLTVSFANISAGVAVVFAVAALAHYTPKRWFEASVNLYVRTPFYVQATAMAALLLAIEYLATSGAAPFIYTNF